MSLKEFEQVRNAKLEMEKAHDRQFAQLAFITASAHGEDVELSDFLQFPDRECTDNQQSPDEQLQYVEGMNAIMGGK